MQEEISKHTKKIYRSMKNQNSAFGEKIKEIFIEIFIIVFAVTFSIWLHDWSEKRHQRKEVKEFLIDIKEDLTNDLNTFEVSSKKLQEVSKNYKLDTNKLDNNKNDTTGNDVLELIILLRLPNTGNYEGFKSSGKIGYIENKILKKEILYYYQQLMPLTTLLENKFTDKFEKLNDELKLEPKITKNILNKPIYKKVASEYFSQINQNISFYQIDTTYAKSIIQKIEKEIKK
jgi:hypothetical protein